MEHPGEIWQEFDYNGIRLGGIDPNNYDADEVKLFGGTAIMLYRYKNDEVEFLFQHRSKMLKDNADKWDVSAGGHINLDEPELDSAVRETKEEIGVKIEKDKLEFAAKYTRGRKVLVCLYFYDWTNEVDDFSFSDNEVEEVKWVPFEELVEFWPNLKPRLCDDQFYQTMLLSWAKLVREKYGDIEE